MGPTIVGRMREGEPTFSSFFFAVMEAIPTIVCDTLYAMGLHDQVPSWKIMDSRGRITVVLHWEKDPALANALTHGGASQGSLLGMLPYHPSASSSAAPSRQASLGSTVAAGGPLPAGAAPGRLLGVRSQSQRSGSSVSSTPCLSRDNSRAGVHHHSMLVQTSLDSSGVPGAGEKQVGLSTFPALSFVAFGPHITVINHDAEAGATALHQQLQHHQLRPGAAAATGGLRPLITGAPSPRQLSR